MNLFYNTAISAYRLCVKLVAHRNEKARKMLHGQAETFDILKRNIQDANDEYIWIHASSLGEFEQGRPLIEMIKKNYPNQKILLTFFSPSGYEVRKNYEGADVICYLPFDLPKNVRMFIDIVQPKMAFFIKYEFWGNYLSELKKRDIPAYIISAIFRPTQSFFKPYGGMFRKMLSCYTTIFVQDDDSKNILSTIGVTNVEVMGDTRFDRVTDILAGCSTFPLIEEFAKNNTTIIIGSSWRPDEDIYIPYFNSHPDIKLIIAPHELSPERIVEIKNRITRPVQEYSTATSANIAKADCLIIDSYGILSSCYRYAQIAYIGGGFGVGIHNVNEAAVYGIPVVFGPNYRKFKEAHDLIACEGGFTFDSTEKFNLLIDSLISDKGLLKIHGDAAGSYIAQNLGATARIFDSLKSTF